MQAFAAQQQNFIQQMLQSRQRQQQQQQQVQNTFSPTSQPNSTFSPQTFQQVNGGIQLQSPIAQNSNMRNSFQNAGLPPLQQQSSYNGSSSNDNFKVVIRVRPPLPRERVEGCEFRNIVQVSNDSKSCAIMEYLGAEVSEYERQRDIEANPHLCVWQNYAFDYVYDELSTQEFVYENTAKTAVLSVLEGYNSTILAYGQTGTGKTYTMEGFKYSAGDPQRGIVPRSMEEIFRFIQMQSNQNTTFMVRASYLQIYNEVISDLLKVDRTSLQIREDKKKGVFVEGLSEWAVRSPNEIYSLMQKGALSRATATTKMNDLSSRSHAVFIIIVEQMTVVDDGSGQVNVYDEDSLKQVKVGKLNLVDLAGSERVRVTGATGKRLVESQKINQSLSSLGNVIAALTDKKSRSHIPYRDSKLTRLLEDSLGGNCKTTMMAMISPSSDALGESLSTLKFATRAKKIKNEARINEDVDQRTLLRKYEIELRKLKYELEERNKQMHENKHLMQLEAEKRRAEEDKAAAINQLEARQKEIQFEKEEKKRLEEKIKMMNSQLLIGGKKIEDTPQFRTALEEKQKLIRQEYEMKLQDIERERNMIEEDKAQVDRYKQLLLKQRDIMIALTSRLNERDETIIQLQEELDAYDRIHREAEQIIEVKTHRVYQLETFLRDQYKVDPPPSQFSDETQFSIGHVRQLSGLLSNNQERKYPPHHQERIDQNDQMALQLLTSNEKITELQQLVEHYGYENEQLRQGNVGQDKIIVNKDRLDELVQKEVQNKLREMGKFGNGDGMVERELQVKSKIVQVIFLGEENNQLRTQVDFLNQEKQAFLMISNDIQGHVMSALQDLVQQKGDPQKSNHQTQQKLAEVTKLVTCLQKHLNQESRFNRSRYSIGSENQVPMSQQKQQIHSSSVQASPSQNHHQQPFNPNVYNQRVGHQSQTTPRNESVPVKHQQNITYHQAPKHQNSASIGNQQQVMQQDYKAQIQASVSEMLRKRQEAKKQS